jgi:hypothetical protein
MQKKKKKKKKKKNTNKQKDKYKNKAKKQYCATFPNQQSRIRNTTHWKSRKSAEHEDKNQINHSHDPTCLIIQKRNKIVQREFQSKDSCSTKWPETQRKAKRNPNFSKQTTQNYKLLHHKKHH